MAKLAAILSIGRNIAGRRPITAGKNFLEITKALFVVAVILFVSSQVFADLIDGEVGGYSEYDIGHYVDFTLDSGETIRGELWQKQEGGSLYLGFVMPRSLVDTSYGKDGGIDNSVDWWKGNKARTHKFKDLVGSDKAKFRLYNTVASGGALALDFTLDYLHGTGTTTNKKGKVKKDKNSPPYFGGLCEDNTATLLGDAEIVFGDGSKIIASATSMEYNWDTFGSYTQHFGTDSYSPLTAWNTLSPALTGPGSIDYSDPAAVAAAYAVVDDPATIGIDESVVLTDWDFDVAYEVQVDLAAFIGGFGYVDIYDAHVSPNKQGYGTDPDETGEIIPVPLPSAALLLVYGFGTVAGITGFRRKFKKS